MKPTSLLVSAATGLLVAAAPCQTHQFQQDQTRSPQLFLPGNHGAATFGDVDGDGDLDALVTEFDFWFQVTSVRLLRDQGGVWQTSTLLTSPGFPGPAIGLTLRDLDGDLDLDAVVVVSGEVGSPDARVVRFENDGAGGLTDVGTTTYVAAATASVAVADLDGDGDQDLVVGTTDAAGVPQPLELLVHDGAFGFAAAPNALPATPASAPAVVDLDGDGDGDVVAVDAAGAVAAFVNQGAVFTGGAVASGPALRVVGGDVDGDGDGDVVAQRPDGGLDLLENRPGGFVATSIAAGGAIVGDAPVLVDLDGDQDLDVAFTLDAELLVLRNDGAAAFTRERVAATSRLAIGDVDQDGVADVLFQVTDLVVRGFAAAIDRGGALRVDPVLLRGPFVARAGSGYLEDAADLDGDGLVDLVQRGYKQLIVRGNLGVDEWRTRFFELTFLRPRARALDLDGDGDQDIAVVNSDATGGLQVFRNDGGLSFTPLPVQAFGYARIAGEGDFDGDGRDDLLVGTGTGSVIQLLRGQPGAGLGAPQTVFAGTADWFMPGIVDFDGDQDLDLLVKPYGDPCVRLLSNDGAGTFTVTNPCLVSFGGGSFNYLEVVDLENDGDPDLFTWGYGSGTFYMHDNGAYTTGATIQGSYGSTLLQPLFADWDGDGDTDLLQLGGPAQLWLNSHGVMTNESATRVTGTFSGAGAADLDADGDLDVLGVLGMSADHRRNHQRSAASVTAPSPGGQMQVRFASRPGYSSGNEVCIPMLTLRRRGAPLFVPGIAGALQVDLTESLLLPLLTFPGVTGTADASFAIPNNANLLGFELYMQGLVFTPVPAFTGAVRESVQ